MDILTNPPQEKVYLDLENLPHNLVAVRINDSIKAFQEELHDGDLNEAHLMAGAQQAWRISESTAENADYVLATVKEKIPGDDEHYAVRIVGVYRPVSALMSAGTEATISLYLLLASFISQIFYY